MKSTKFKGYVDFNPKVILCKDIEDMADYHVTLPTPAKAEDILGFGKSFEDQFFEPVWKALSDDDLKKLWALEHLVKSERDKAAAFKALESNPVLANFVAYAHDVFENGQFQYIRGVPTYIPGNYLKYCSYNRIPDKIAQFRDWDLHKFYWWNFCVIPDPICFGGIEMTRRQVGKSFIGGFLAGDTAVSNKSGVVGIQSKTEDDAKGEFRRTIVVPRKYYPFWLRGHSSTDLTTKGDSIEYDYPDHLGNASLDSMVSYKSSGPSAYDGTKLLFYYNAECGKNVESDVYEILSVVRPMLMEDSSIRGKSLWSSTVEEMSKRGGQNFKNIWIDSDRRTYKDKSKQKVDDTGRTVSGLFPYFTPSQNNYLPDQYGMAIVDDPFPYQYEFLLKKYTKERHKYPEREAKKGGKQLIDERIDRQKADSKKQEEIRKYPRTVKEAFRASAVGCLYDLGKINARLDVLYNGNDHLVTHGKFGWVNNIKFGTVEFIATSKEEARCQISLLPQIYANQFTEGYGGRIPSNSHLFTAGCDCFMNNIVLDVGRSSKGAGHVYAGFNERFDDIGADSSTWVTDDFVCEYYYRHEGMLYEEFAEDMLMMCIYYGCKMSPESNLRVVQDYFYKHNFTNYLMFAEKLKLKNGILQTETNMVAGSYTGGDESKQPMVNSISRYVREKIHRCKFPRTIEQFRDMDYVDFRPWDLFVSASKCYMYHNEVADRYKEPDPVDPSLDYMWMLPTYGK